MLILTLETKKHCQRHNALMAIRHRAFKLNRVPESKSKSLGQASTCFCLARILLGARDTECFFNWPPPLDWPALKMPRLAPPKSFKYENHIKVLRHLDFFRSWGGAVWDSNVFSKSFTYWPALSKFKGGPVKKNTLYAHTYLFC